MNWLLASRRRVFLSAPGLLLALDLGRSIFARLGYAHPTSTWQPDPSVYSALPVLTHENRAVGGEVKRS
jgi:hypothetical protein